VDTARTFPPEASVKTPHLESYPLEGAMVVVDLRECGAYAMKSDRHLSPEEVEALPALAKGRVLNVKYGQRTDATVCVPSPAAPADGDFAVKPSAYDVVLFDDHAHHVKG
jgi:hypothetical protein